VRDEARIVGGRSKGSRRCNRGVADDGDGDGVDVATNGALILTAPVTAAPVPGEDPAAPAGPAATSAPTTTATPPAARTPIRDLRVLSGAELMLHP